MKSRIETILKKKKERKRKTMRGKIKVLAIKFIFNNYVKIKKEHL